MSKSAMSKKQYDYHDALWRECRSITGLTREGCRKRTKRILRRLVLEAVMKSLEFDMTPFAEREEEAHRIAKSLVH